MTPHSLQPSGLARNPYQRPQDKWVCGRACDGKATCALGPDTKGCCQNTAECVPVRKGDRWHCTRPEISGGACQQGPLPDGACCHPAPPCIPQLSLRALRGRFIVAISSLTLGFVFFWLFRPLESLEAISPGHLSSSHSAAAMGCTDCHESESLNLAVFAGGFEALHQRAMREGQLCLDCHHIGPSPFSPHGTGLKVADKGDLWIKEAPMSAGVAVFLSQMLDLAPQGDIACSTCHSEHKGLDADIKRISQQQCQTCHQNTFNSFAKGHPEFDAYPYERRTRIQFDHISHINTHFKDPKFEGMSQQSCSDCHTPSTDGRLMLAKSFEVSCATCHSEQIEGAGRAGDPGIEVLRIPGLDALALTEAGHDIGEWPKFAEGTATPYLVAMLSSTPEVAEAYDRIKSVDWLDLSGASQETIADVATVAWGIKSVLHQLLVEGQDALIASTLSQPQNSDRNSATQANALLLAGLPYDTVKALQQAWFPNLREDIAAHQAGLPTASTIDQLQQTQTKQTTQTTTILKNTDASDDLLADDLLTDDLLEADIPPEKQPASPQKTTDDDLLAEDNLLASEDDLLAEEDDLLNADDNLLLDGEPSAKSSPSPALTKTATPQSLPKPEVWTSHGGWYRQDATYTLHYRPTGHADAFLKAWIDVSAKRATSDPFQGIFATLTNETAPGLCSKCHAIDTTPEKEIAMQWRSRQPEANPRGHTIFNHQAHFSLLDDRGCYTCHTMKDSSGYADASKLGSTNKRFSKQTSKHFQYKLAQSVTTRETFLITAPPATIITLEHWKRFFPEITLFRSNPSEAPSIKG